MNLKSDQIAFLFHIVLKSLLHRLLSNFEQVKCSVSKYYVSLLENDDYLNFKNIYGEGIKTSVKSMP